jgi:8-amino-7-oxononanoate synthase
MKNLTFEKLLQEKLVQRQQQNSLRKLVPFLPHQIDFFSNDYLGLAQNTILFERIHQKVGEYNRQKHFKNGSSGARLLSGNSELAEQVETELAHFFRAEAALFFSSGYLANLAVFGTLPTRQSVILYDELCHASMKEGMRLSFAQRFSFKHNDVIDLERQLQQHQNKTIFVAVESIYSMDGDVCLLSEITQLCEKYNAFLCIDEAHSTGILGKNGNGLACQFGLEQNIPIRVHTFGKAMGNHGACVVGSKTLIDYLINFALPFIYTTAPAPHQFIAAQQTIRFLQENTQLIAELYTKINYFDSLVGNAINNIPTPIRIIVAPGNECAKNKAQQLQQAGLEVRPILSPTVKVGSERIRICLHQFNTHQEIEKLVNAISD